ncbi:4'-phosphopantetheinyl transferase [Luteimonas cucumeris]|uniref:4'-phosphopantetheinyl transferase n=1 Tax=Luteimonas cucumeris TaxID=985012 RepID=A0A562KXM5_9GAMM|nr:4'-phosphopantetheinyl transferase superfamily protein [Luteimonas cucumeris]TWH99943.1 4'-phosphopantetheinyl transferase [Luteimonas cucumeris]
MSSTDAGHAIGPIRWAWQPHPRTQPAEPAARRWLERSLGLAPDTLPVAREPRGRPRIQPPAGHYDASWSHSGEGLLVALGQDIELGVDMEWRRPRPRALELAQRYYAEVETQWLSTLDTTACEETFLRLWCAKEAVLKAHGHGLAFGLHRLAFAAHAQGLAMTACDPALGLPSDWRLHEFEPAPGYLAAIAWRLPPTRSSPMQ